MIDEKYIYNKKYDTFCLQNCINYILFKHGVRNSELYINKALSFVLKKTHGSELKYFFDEGVIPSQADKIITYRSTEDSDVVLKKIMIAANKEKYELVMGVDSFELSYTPYFKKSHGLHSVIVNYVDFDKNIVNITDIMEKCYFEGNISLDEFLRARQSENAADGGIFSNIKFDNVWSKVYFVGYNEDAKDLVKEQIQLTIRQYYEGDEDKESISGIGAFNYIIEKLENHNQLSNNEQNTLLDGIHKIIYRFSFRRLFWSHFFDTIPDVLKDELLIQYQHQLDAQQGDWDKLKYKVLVLKLRKKEQLWNDVIDLIKKCVSHDAKNGELLKEYVRK